MNFITCHLQRKSVIWINISMVFWMFLQAYVASEKLNRYANNSDWLVKTSQNINFKGYYISDLLSRTHVKEGNCSYLWYAVHWGWLWRYIYQNLLIPYYNAKLIIYVFFLFIKESKIYSFQSILAHNCSVSFKDQLTLLLSSIKKMCKTVI